MRFLSVMLVVCVSLRALAPELPTGPNLFTWPGNGQLWGVELNGVNTTNQDWASIHIEISNDATNWTAVGWAFSTTNTIIFVRLRPCRPGVLAVGEIDDGTHAARHAESP